MRNVTTVIQYAEDGAYARNWYHQAHTEIAQLFGVANVGLVADVLAITSPRVSVLKGMRITLAYLKDGSLDGVMQPTRAALLHWERTQEIRGPKTSAFSQALRGNSNAVVIDVWMARLLDVEHKSVSKKRIYQQTSAVIRRTAERLGWLPCEAQAACWTSIRLEYGYRDKRLSYISLLETFGLFRSLYMEEVMIGIDNLNQRLG